MNQSIEAVKNSPGIYVVGDSTVNWEFILIRVREDGTIVQVNYDLTDENGPFSDDGWMPTAKVIGKVIV